MASAGLTTPHIRWLAYHSETPAFAFAGTEPATIFVSWDGAQTQSFIHPDVHSVVVHPSSPDLTFAPTGGGFYRSNDGGKTWVRLYDCYCRAVWADPADPNHLLLGPADSVDSNGRIEETVDGGRTWRLASTGLQVPWPRHMVERFVQVGSELLAALSNGHLLAAPLETLTWRRILPQVTEVVAVAPMR
jgi:hypothetical protein